MTPPDAAQGNRLDAGARDAAPAVSVCPPKTPIMPLAYVRHGVLNVLANRSDFLKTASARRQGTGSFLLQARDRRDDEALVRIGFTASKKVGNAVLRARAKRRLRSLARELLGGLGRPGWDYVLVARPNATVLDDYLVMRAALEGAFASVHRDRDRAERDSKRAAPATASASAIEPAIEPAAAPIAASGADSVAQAATAAPASASAPATLTAAGDRAGAVRATK